MTYLSLENSLRIRFTKRGNASQVIVLLHGWKQSHRLFDRMIQELSKDFTVLAFDHRGMGESDKPDTDYNFSELAGDLKEILAHFDLSDVTLLCWSMGCTVGLSALKIGEPRITRIALLNGPLNLTKSADFPYALEEEVLERYIAGMENNWPFEEYKFYEDSLLPKNHELASLLYNIGMQTPLDIGLKLVRAQAKIDHRETIKELEIPVLAIYSHFDPYWPVALGQWISDNGKSASLVTLEESAHCAPLEEPGRLSQVIREFVGVH
jgi:non-heme chloroperoxidase